MLGIRTESEGKIMNWRHEILAGTFLVVSLTILGLIGWGFHQRNLKVAAEAAYTQQSVELEGAKRALLAKPSEVVKFVEVPAAVTKAVKSGAMLPIAATKVEATSTPVMIPCPEPPEVTPTKPEETVAVHHTNPVTFGLTGEFFIGKIKGGAVEHTSTLKGTVWMDATDTDPAWNSDIEFKPENVKVDVRVSKDIAAAVEAYEQPWTKKHLRFACPVVFAGLDIDGQINGGIGCAYGVVW